MISKGELWSGVSGMVAWINGGEEWWSSVRV